MDRFLDCVDCVGEDDIDDILSIFSTDGCQA
jgi:hypothetical protein